MSWLAAELKGAWLRAEQTSLNVSNAVNAALHEQRSDGTCVTIDASYSFPTLLFFSIRVPVAFWLSPAFSPHLPPVAPAAQPDAPILRSAVLSNTESSFTLKFSGMCYCSEDTSSGADVSLCGYDTASGVFDYG